MFKSVCLFALFAFMALPAEATISNSLMMTVRPKLIQCAKDWNVPDDDLNTIIANDLSNDNHNNQCLSLCFMNQLGMFELDGSINVLTSIAKFSLGENVFNVVKIVNKCKVLKGTDACNTAWLVYSCYVNEHLL